MSQNHYQVLGVPASASAEVIKQAYRRLANQLHPDKHGGDPRYEEQFKAVAAAYRVLSDAGRRAQYDSQQQYAAQYAETQRRAAAEAAAGGPSVYHMPPPMAAPPMRTRPPAGSRERHYQQRVPRQQVRFNRQDFWLVAAITGLIFLFGISAKVVMDRVAAGVNYDDARTAFAQGQWSTAYSYLDQAIGFREDYTSALRLRGQLAEDINHDYPAARADYQAALLASAAGTDPLPPPEAARVFYRLGRCQAVLHQPTEAERSYSQALRLDTTLAEAYLARGENRLLDLRRPRPALADLHQGRRQYQRLGRAVPLAYLQAEGAALAHLGRYADARTAYFQALESQPADGRTLFLLGRLAQQMGDSASGCSFFQRGAVAGYAYAVKAAQQCN
ncbi:J domain-containing protein [Hymenobacter bucti]|uniref:DnaJ domain-containing protein n=1 Tax=Hymenobacter bucti TaxID=1844114 RepID=A0ABW4QN20_9BACT